MNKVTVGYIRVSTLQQAEEGISLDNQKKRIHAYCALYGLHLIDIIEDAGLSGKSVSGRPGIQRVLDLVSSRKINSLVVMKLDRLARNVRECLQIVELLEKKKVSLHSVSEKIDTGSAHGRLFLVILSAMATWEREVNAERVKSVLSNKKTNNERISRYPPYGYIFTDDGKLKEHSREQQLIKKVHELRDRGLSIRKITCNLNRMGYQNRMCNPVSHTLVHKILQSAG